MNDERAYVCVSNLKLVRQMAPGPRTIAKFLGLSVPRSIILASCGSIYLDVTRKTALQLVADQLATCRRHTRNFATRSATGSRLARVMERNTEQNRHIVRWQLIC